jgi:hypothetical protein
VLQRAEPLLQLLLLWFRSWVKGYALPRRAYIGPTSMDPEVAFLMTNLAQVCWRFLSTGQYGYSLCLLAYTPATRRYMCTWILRWRVLIIRYVAKVQRR